MFRAVLASCVLVACLTTAGPAAARIVGNGTPASCTSRAVVAAVRAGGLIRFSCGPRPVTIRMKETARVRNTASRVVLDGGGLVTLSGMGTAADPVHGYVRSEAGVDDLALSGSGEPAAHGREPGPRRRELDRAALRRRGRRRDLRPRRAAADRGGVVRRQPLRAHRPGPRRWGGPRAVAVPRSSGAHHRQPVHRQRLQQRWCAQQHRGVVDGPREPVRRQPCDRDRRQSATGRDAGRWQRRRDLQRRRPDDADDHAAARSNTIRPARVVARCSSSATIAPGRSSSGTAR